MALKNAKIPFLVKSTPTNWFSQNTARSPISEKEGADSTEKVSVLEVASVTSCTTRLSKRRSRRPSSTRCTKDTLNTKSIFVPNKIEGGAGTDTAETEKEEGDQGQGIEEKIERDTEDPGPEIDAQGRDQGTKGQKKTKKGKREEAVPKAKKAKKVHFLTYLDLLQLSSEERRKRIAMWNEEANNEENKSGDGENN